MTNIISTIAGFNYDKPITNTDLTGLGVAVALPITIGLVSSRNTPGEWYKTLQKPPITPPNWAFPAVWMSLYTLMGGSSWLVWWANGSPTTLSSPAFSSVVAPLSVYGASLIFNGAWSYLMFGRHKIGASLVDIGLLWSSIVTYTGLFYSSVPAAGLMNLPYIAWVSLASYLNYYIWSHNKEKSE
eukprot:gb/GECH01002833.1/.p1 GENE.gb/GECH01002833.1/~~gb/GECH01002833.1/.p1  ORF type:complete len:185 (+),score=7.22 gb/GECH01002833.1/:1-555(+)